MKLFTDSIFGNWFVLMGLPMPGIMAFILVEESFGFYWGVLASVGVIILLTPLYPWFIRGIHKMFG